MVAFLFIKQMIIKLIFELLTLAMGGRRYPTLRF
ncbi:Uncharacterised protein [Yersinia kristensenii]|nr:Uncharacterised protein [Yersinia kristensenii]SUP67732.1 Uncharacterised protein [Yersinia kristensenii]